jgi:hypothetical protein
VNLPLLAGSDEAILLVNPGEILEFVRLDDRLKFLNP